MRKRTTFINTTNSSYLFGRPKKPSRLKSAAIGAGVGAAAGYNAGGIAGGVMGGLRGATDSFVRKNGYNSLLTRAKRYASTSFAGKVSNDAKTIGTLSGATGGLTGAVRGGIRGLKGGWKGALGGAINQGAKSAWKAGKRGAAIGAGIGGLRGLKRKKNYLLPIS